MTNRFKAILGSTIAGALALAIAPMANADDAPAKHGHMTVTAQNGGHVIGDPQATVTLTEWVSYTCGHCAEFALNGDGALKLAYLPTRKLKVEVRHIIRDPVDLTATVLAHCGDPARFDKRHAMFMHRQADWLPKVQQSSEAQRQRWSTGPVPARLRAIASDLDFYTLIASHGIDRPAADRCLSDTAKVQSLIANTQSDADTYGIQGTPSFAIDGQLLDATHSWKALQPQLDAALN